MKKALFIHFLLVIQFQVFSQWNPVQNIPTTSDLFSITFPSENIGFAVGHEVVMKSTNGGESWSKVSVPNELNTYWKSTHFINDTVGFVTGINGFMRTNDGGLTWEGDSSIINYFTSVFFLNDTVGFVTSEDNSIYKTFNAGRSWTSQQLVTGNSGLNDVYFTTQDTGYCVGYQELGLDRYEGVIFKTTNGGISWTESITTSTKLNEIRFNNKGFGTAVGTFGYIATSFDNGLNWSEQNICDSCELTTVLITNQSTSIIAGYSPAWIQGGNPQKGVIFYSSDTGKVWNSTLIPSTLPLQSLATNDSNKVLCVGFNGTVLINKDTGVSLIEIKNNQFVNYDFSLYPNPTANIIEVKYELNKPSSVNISIVDLMGKEIKQVHCGKENQGVNIKSFNLHQESDGVYFIKMTINEQKIIKMIVKRSL